VTLLVGMRPIDMTRMAVTAVALSSNRSTMSMRLLLFWVTDTRANYETILHGERSGTTCNRSRLLKGCVP
jgi:hypothetical protein